MNTKLVPKKSSRYPSVWVASCGTSKARHLTPRISVSNPGRSTLRDPPISGPTAFYLRSDSLMPRESIVQPRRSVHRHRQPLGHGSQSADMVHMIVRDENHLHRSDIHTGTGKPGLDSPETHPGIHYQSRALIPYVVTVTVAPAGDTQKSCHKGLPWN